MKIFIYFIIGYVTLFLTVWLHEVGHSLFYGIYGCKKNIFHVTVKPYIFFSTPSPVDDMEKVENLTLKQNTIISYAGVCANGIWVLITMIILQLPIQNLYVSFFLWMFATLHMAEIVSYMLIGNIYLVSDMANIAACYPKLRLPNFLIGSVLTVLYIFILNTVPHTFVAFLIVYNILTILCMCGGRIFFSIKAKRQNG